MPRGHPPEEKDLWIAASAEMTGLGASVRASNVRRKRRGQETLGVVDVLESVAR